MYTCMSIYMLFYILLYELYVYYIIIVLLSDLTDRSTAVWFGSVRDCEKLVKNMKAPILKFFFT